MKNFIGLILVALLIISVTTIAHGMGGGRGFGSGFGFGTCGGGYGSGYGRGYDSEYCYDEDDASDTDSHYNNSYGYRRNRMSGMRGGQGNFNRRHNNMNLSENFPEMHEYYLEKYDINNDGILTGDERTKMFESKRALMKECDADNDGKLNSEEFETLKDKLNDLIKTK